MERDRRANASEEPEGRAMMMEELRAGDGRKGGWEKRKEELERLEVEGRMIGGGG